MLSRLLAVFSAVSLLGQIVRGTAMIAYFLFCYWLIDKLFSDP